MMIFMFPVMAILVAYLFIPLLARLKVYTVYEYLERRFGLESRLFASAVFLLQRAAHMAIAIYAISLALQQIVGWPVWACAAIVGGLTTLYTVLGGMKAVLWTDVMQFFVLVGSVLVMVGVIICSFHGDMARSGGCGRRRPHENGWTSRATSGTRFLEGDDHLGHLLGGCWSHKSAPTEAIRSWCSVIWRPAPPG